MKQVLLLLILCLTLPAFGQKKKMTELHLTNALIIGQIDNVEDRYSLEIILTQMFTAAKIKSMPSLNVLKQGSDAVVLATDSVQQMLAAKGIDTYALVCVRGYDRRFKVSEKQDDFRTALEGSSLFDLYRQDITSVSIEFKFYRQGQYVGGDILKCGNISDRETVLKRISNKLEKRIYKKWR